MTGAGTAHLAAHLLLWAGVGCFLVSAAALPFLPGGLARLHALAPAGGLGTPLIACAVALEQGAGRAAGKTLLIGLLLAAGSTVTTIAVAKATADEDRHQDQEHPPGMDDALTLTSLLLVVAAATLAVLCREPVRQAVALAALGLALTLLFLVLQAPDVALSQLAVGTALTPLLILLTARKVRRPPARPGEREDRP